MSDELPIEVDVHAVAELQNQDAQFLLLDVREADEYAAAKINGSTLIPMSDFGERIGELDDHRDARIIVHCHHGGRSMQVTHFLRSKGFAQVQNMAGGIDDWSQRIDPSVPRY